MKYVRITISIPEKVLEEIDNYRAKLRPIPTRSEAIVKLIRIGLNAYLVATEEAAKL